METDMGNLLRELTDVRFHKWASLDVQKLAERSWGPEGVMLKAKTVPQSFLGPLVGMSGIQLFKPLAKINEGKPHWHDLGRPAGGALAPRLSSTIAGPRAREEKDPVKPWYLSFCFTSQQKGRLLPSPCNSPANDRLSQLSQWEATVLGTPSLANGLFL